MSSAGMSSSFAKVEIALSCSVLAKVAPIGGIAIVPKVDFRSSGAKCVVCLASQYQPDKRD